MSASDPRVLVRVQVVLDRLRASASKYVRMSKFGALDRAALALLVERGEIEIFDSPIGRAYRIKVDVAGVGDGGEEDSGANG